MIWANLIHIYQPPTQTGAIVEKVYAEAYQKIVNILTAYPDARLTVNINATLTEQLQRYDLTGVLDTLSELAAARQIEFTGSAKFHPILPLIHPREAERQIRLNEDTNRELLGNSYQPRGFFLPELCYSRSIAELIERLGYEWLILDEIAYNGRLGSLRALEQCVYALRGSQLKVVFRNRRASNLISFGGMPRGAEFLNELERLQVGGDSAGYLLTATDGEVYGHHRKGQEKLLSDLYSARAVETSTISELVNTVEVQETVEPVASSWSAGEDELKADIPYPQWRFPGNLIHQRQWRLANLATAAVHQAEAEGEVEPAVRAGLDEGLHSCQFWWASCRPWWNVEMIRKGAERLFSAVDGLRGAVDERIVAEAAWLAEHIVTYAEELQRSGDALRLQRAYLESHRAVTSLLTFGSAREAKDKRR